MTTHHRLHIALTLILLMLLLTACRRDLWVYTDDLHQVDLVTDWSEATELPDGMTWWFMKDDHTGDYHSKTAEVTHAWLNIPRGLYSGVVFDYSPEEYSHQEFVGMDHIGNALVHILPSADQPEPDAELYGAPAVREFGPAIPLYELVIAECRARGFRVETGVFGAEMQVASVNDGPVTILLDTKEL